MEISVQEMVLPIVVFFTMVSVGLDLEVSQFATVLRQPRLPLPGTLIHRFAFPCVALSLVGVVVLFNLPVDDALLVGTLLIAACPSGGFSNVLVLMARADLALSVILTTISTALSFLTISLFFWGFARFLPEGAVGIDVPLGTTLLQLLILIVVPSALEGWWRQAFPRSAIRYKSGFQRLMQLAVYVVVALILAEQWDLVSGICSRRWPGLWGFAGHPRRQVWDRGLGRFTGLCMRYHCTGKFHPESDGSISRGNQHP